MSNLRSINCFETHGNGQTDPVLFTTQTHPSQQRLGTLNNNAIYSQTETAPVFYNPYPETLYIFQYQANIRYFDFTLLCILCRMISLI